MRFLWNLKIATKILGIVLVLLGATGAIAWNSISGILLLEDDAAILGRYGEQVEQAGRGTANMLMWVRTIEAYPKDMPPADRQAVHAAAKDEQARMQRRIDAIAKADNGRNAAALTALAGAVKAFDETSARVLALVDSGKPNEAMALLLGSAGEIDAMRRAFHAIEDEILRHANEAVAHSIHEGDRVIMTVTTVTALAVLIGLGVALFISIWGISRPLSKSIAAMNRLAAGDLDVQLDATQRRDEIGQIDQALLAFHRNALEKRQAEAATEEQRRQFAAEREAADRQFEASIGQAVAMAAAGDLSARVPANDLAGVMQRVGESMNTLLSLTQKVFTAIHNTTAAMADGDLTSRIDEPFKGQFGTVAANVNAMGERLAEFASRLAASTDTVRTAAADISSSSQDLAHRTESQAASIEETAASMQEVTATVKQNADNATTANQLAGAARNSADHGGSVMNEVVTAMQRIKESASRIADIVTLMDEIAFQTNLLALNASVEAARAGETGKGFAVVAQEVRALAQRSANASKDIKSLIAASDAEVREGSKLVGQCGQALHEIVAAIKKVSDIVGEIAAASQEQAVGLEQINTAVTQMDELTQRNGALVEESSASAQALAEQARELASLVAFFKLRKPMQYALAAQ